MGKPGYPTRHVSVRVPWHDSGWTGVVCKAPQLNAACTKLKGIAERKSEARESAIAGISFDKLPVGEWPYCVEERSSFMAPFEMEHVKHHALAQRDRNHYGHFRPTKQRYPSYSAGIVPFRWMKRDSLESFRDEFELEVDPNREPELGYETKWVHDAMNQESLLDGFAAHLRPDVSLCLFYSKAVPFVEGTDRILVGVGRVRGLGPLTEYAREGPGMRGFVWERPLQHSIRPDSKDGFLVPFQELLRRAEADPSLDLERFTPFAPEDHWDEFSYASELVSHDGAIGALLSLDASLALMQSELGILTERYQQWIHEELVRLWKVRGPFPGLGAVLSAFGLTRGVFVAHALQGTVGENADPWPLVGEAFHDPERVLSKELSKDFKELSPIWKRLPDERRLYLRLLSRFDLTKAQSEALYEDGARKRRGWDGADGEFLRNPYRIYEVTRLHPEGVRLLTIDRGVFPDDSIRLRHPLEGPSRLESALDLRRVRALTISVLEAATAKGDTLLSNDSVVEAILGLPIHPGCPVTGDILLARGGDMHPEVAVVSQDGSTALQLARYSAIGELVRKQVKGRLAGRRHVVSQDWGALLEEKFGPAKDDDEKRARAEKIAVLKELAESRFSVLVGPAGAGKTSVLGVLCSLPEVRLEGLLLLAPTGKARVRMQELVGSGGIKALTLAQFLNQSGRYEVSSGRYIMRDAPRATEYASVIVDESSMLTEDMLGALFDALQGVKRFVFVGDPAQLPPIGAGRPFVDIVTELRPADSESRFPRISAGYAELTVERRQQGKDRADLRLVPHPQTPLDLSDGRQM